MPQIAVRLSTQELAEIDAAVSAGIAKTRAEAVRMGLELLRRQRRDEEIAEEYRRAYAEQPLTEQETGFADAALKTMKPW